MNLVIVESPTKAKTLSRFLGKGYSVRASMGHVRDLPKSTLGVDLKKNFAPEYVVVKGREQTIAELKREAKRAKNLILATDPDREGEAIGFHTAYLLGVKKPVRIVFHEITKSAVEQALSHPGQINMDLVDAQQGRRVLDRLVGYKLSPLLWRKIRRGLSAGRVQSVAVRLIVDREREIEAFKPEEYWEIKVQVENSEKKDFWLDLVAIDGKRAKKGEFLITGKARASSVVADLNKAEYWVSKVEKKQAKQSPPPPFMTSTLQRAAARSFGWSSRKTMRAAQRLYEAGLITYHRTDSLNISSMALRQAASFIKNTYGENYALPQPRRFKSKSKLAQEAHEAIRPTKVSRDSLASKAGLAADSKRLYTTIWRRFVASQMAEAVFDRTRIVVEAKRQAAKAKFREYLLSASGRVMKFEGWQAVYGGGKSAKLKAQDGAARLPELAEGEKLKKKRVTAEQKFTEPPARFNEASLIKALEDRGIGRPSTYAPTISTIQSRQYVEKKDQRFYPTAVGVAVTDFLLKYFPEIMDYDFTASMEDDLDKIAQGKRQWVKVIKAFYGPFGKHLDKVQETAKRVKVEVEKTGDKCPECEKQGLPVNKRGDVVIRIGRFGKFLSCSRFPECRYTQNYVEKVEGIKCPEDKGEIVIRKTRKGKRFYGCSNYPKCKWASWRKPK